MLRPRQRPPRGLCVAVLQHIEDSIEIRQHGQYRIAVGREELFVIHRRIHRAHQFKDRSQCVGGVQIVVQRFKIPCACLLRHFLQHGIFARQKLPRFQPRPERAQPVDRVSGVCQAVEGEVERTPVRHRDQRQADGRRFESLKQQVAQRVEVALALRHLPAVHQQEPHMHPMPRELLVRRRFALRNLVFVVRKHQVFAAAVQVEALAQVLHRHGRALNVPSRTARPDRRVPRHLTRLGCLPQRKVACRILLVLVHVHARAVFHAAQVFLAQLAVLWKRLEPEVP